MYKKSGFTFLEILMVMLIVSILFVAFKSSFQIKNKDILYSQACIETIYGKINNFLYAGLRSKLINTGISIDQYNITFMPETQVIELKYTEKENNNEYIYSTIYITGNENNMYCNNDNYTIQLTGETYEIYINKGFQESTTPQYFYLSGEKLSGEKILSTGENIFLQCNNQGNECKTIARFESDTRTITIKKQICLNFSDTGDCLEWDN